MEEKAGQQTGREARCRGPLDLEMGAFLGKSSSCAEESPPCSPEAGDGGLSRVLKIISDKPRPPGTGPAPLLPLAADWPKAVNQIVNDEGTEAGKRDNGSAKMKSTGIHHRCCETEG